MPTISRPSDTKFKVIIEGGPQLAAALNELDHKIKLTLAKSAIAAAGRVIADEWAAMAPEGTAPHDDFPGAYRASLRQDDAVKARGSKNGATGTVAPAYIGLGKSDPTLYAAVLEFGWPEKHIHPEPSARPAFDAALNAAIAALSSKLADGIK